MNYLMMDHEVDSLPREVSLPPGCGGVAIVLRRNRIPVGFVMRESRQDGNVPLQDLPLESLPSGQIPDSNAPLPGIRKVTIAVCTYNRPDTLARCLESIVGIDPSGLELEFLVVDNASPDRRTFQVASSFPQVTYLLEKQRGLSHARNRAIRAATGEVIVFIDDDAVPDKDWIGGIRAAFQQNPEAMAVSGPIMPMELATDAQILYQGRGGHCRGCQKVVFTSTLPGSPTYPCGEASFGAGANMAFRVKLFEQIGLFDPLLSTSSAAADDLDIFYRTIRAGFKWAYEPQMLVFHEDRRDMASLRRQAYNWSCGNSAYMMKSYSTDPKNRRKIIRFLTRLIVRKAGGVVASGVGARRYRWPVSLAWAEFRGAVAGLAAYRAR